MTKKVLKVLVVTLFFILVGLLGLYFYLNKNTGKQSSVLIFIPSQTQLVLRISETSKTLNSFFDNSMVNECFKLTEPKKSWAAIDSITSRNYKTAEILMKSTSFVCLDSGLNYLVLVDLNKRTNEHFIDQFIANSTSLRKIEKFPEGYKAFYTNGGLPIYYFVRNNVFGASNNSDFLKQSILQGQSEKIDPQMSSWDGNSKSQLTVWGKNGTESRILKKFMYDESIFGDWLDKFSQSVWFNISWDDLKLNFDGSLSYDSINPEIRKFANSKIQKNYGFYQSDTASYKNQFYNVLVSDSQKVMQPISLMHYQYIDTLNAMVSVLVSNSPLTAQLYFSTIRDTAVQLIPMADENIKQIAVMERRMIANITPFIPLELDSGKLFVTIFNNYLFIAGSTEVLLAFAPGYPATNFVDKSIEPKCFIAARNQVWFNKPYQLTYSYQWGAKNTISFSTQIAKFRAK